jgi:hypothetical protein
VCGCTWAKLGHHSSSQDFAKFIELSLSHPVFGPWFDLIIPVSSSIWVCSCNTSKTGYLSSSQRFWENIRIILKIRPVFGP